MEIAVFSPKQYKDLLSQWRTIFFCCCSQNPIETTTFCITCRKHENPTTKTLKTFMLNKKKKSLRSVSLFQLRAKMEHMRCTRVPSQNLTHCVAEFFAHTVHCRFESVIFCICGVHQLECEPMHWI